MTVTFSQETLPAMHCRVSISQSEFTASTASLHFDYNRLDVTALAGVSQKLIMRHKTRKKKCNH